MGLQACQLNLREQSGGSVKAEPPLCSGTWPQLLQQRAMSSAAKHGGALRESTGMPHWGAASFMYVQHSHAQPGAATKRHKLEASWPVRALAT